MFPSPAQTNTHVQTQVEAQSRMETLTTLCQHTCSQHYEILYAHTDMNLLSSKFIQNTNTYVSAYGRARIFKGLP